MIRVTTSDRGPGFDVIGDVHGYAGPLQALLGELGYDVVDGAHRHPSRTAVFVGDLIDRGPSQLETLRIVRAMVEAGAARIVLGNHEFNAIAYATIDPARLEYCRTHNDKHDSQHREFLDRGRLRHADPPRRRRLVPHDPAVARPRRPARRARLLEPGAHLNAAPGTAAGTCSRHEG